MAPRGRRRRHARPASPPPALEIDDLLRKIFLLLPPQPSTIPRLSAVCKQWRNVVTDRQFLRVFREQHRKPPLLGLVMGDSGNPYFRSSLGPPDNIPHERFFPPDILSMHMDLFDCRHGRVVFFDHKLSEVLLFDPATRRRHYVAAPQVFKETGTDVVNAAVVCAARDEGHVHGDCHTSPFQVVLIGIGDLNKRVSASVYSSESGMWGDIISIQNGWICNLRQPSTLIGNALYWLFIGNEEEVMLEFHLGRQSLAKIQMPVGLEDYEDHTLQILVAEHGYVGLAILSCYTFEMWERKVSYDDAFDTWELKNAVELNTILGLSESETEESEISCKGGHDTCIMGYDEVDHVIYIWTDIGISMIQLNLMELKELGVDNFSESAYLPYRSFYTAVSDLAVCEVRTPDISAPIAKDDSCMAVASWDVGAVGSNDAAASSGTSLKGGTFDKSKA